MDNTSASSGVGIGGLMFVVFLVLKLIGVIAWSWWWVFSPIWIPIAIILLFFIVFLLIKFIAGE